MQHRDRTEFLGEVIKDGRRDKSKNTAAFNAKAKKRRDKARHDAKTRKINQRKKK